jgi:PAS domain S-box-containing protein
VIEFFSRETREPDEQLLDMFGVIGKQVGQFIERKEAETAQQQIQNQLELRVRQRTAQLAAANAGLRVEALETKRAEEEVRQTNNENQELYNTAPCGYHTLDKDGVFTRINDTLLNWLGYTREEVIGRMKFTDILTDHSRQIMEHDPELFLRRERVHNVEFELVRRDGSVAPVLLSANVVEDSLGQVIKSCATLFDLTERKQADAALRQRDDQLRQSQKLEAIGVLAGGVAHEFNNLLQAICGYTTYAIEGLEPDDRRFQDLEQVLAAADRAATLTKQLLGFGRRQMLKRVDIDFNQLVIDLGKMLRPLIGEHICLDIVPGENIGAIHADPGLFQQVLMNLCVNSRDAMPGGGRLLVKTLDVTLSDAYCEIHTDMRPGRYVLLTVSDTGSGMTTEVMSRIFEPFFTTKEVGKGTGLGLAMVYGIVQQHGGMIQVYSEPGQGTEFKIYLPVVAVATAAEIIPPSRSITGGTETILIAEDEEIVRNLAARILGEAGYRVLLAGDGEHAIKIFEEHADTIDLALLDMVMPRLNGHDVYQRFKLRKPNLKAIFCSGYDPETSQVGFVTEVGMQLLQKPFDPDELLHTVRQVLDMPLATGLVGIGANQAAHALETI